MTRPALSRLLAAILLLLGTFMAPGSGVSHGLAHLREAEHHAEHEADGAAGHDEHGDRGQQEIEGESHHDDHAHVRVDDGIRPRVQPLVAAIAEQVVVPVARELVVATVAPVPHRARARADPHTGPPPTLRAPPAA